MYRKMKRLAIKAKDDAESLANEYSDNITGLTEEIALLQQR